MPSETDVEIFLWSHLSSFSHKQHAIFFFQLLPTLWLFPTIANAGNILSFICGSCFKRPVLYLRSVLHHNAVIWLKRFPTFMSKRTHHRVFYLWWNGEGQTQRAQVYAQVSNTSQSSIWLWCLTVSIVWNVIRRYERFEELLLRD